MNTEFETRIKYLWLLCKSSFICQKPAIMGDIEIFADCLVESNCIAVEPCEVLFVPLEGYEAHLKFDSIFNQLLLKELAYKLRTCTISLRVNALSQSVYFQPLITHGWIHITFKSIYKNKYYRWCCLIDWYYKKGLY